jgi:hypothetical protein
MGLALRLTLNYAAGLGGGRALVETGWVVWAIEAGNNLARPGSLGKRHEFQLSDRVAALVMGPIIQERA